MTDEELKERLTACIWEHLEPLEAKLREVSTQHNRIEELEAEEKETTTMTDITVNETKREVFFTNGQRRRFHNVTMFNADGNWLRLKCDEGYILLNPPNIDFMVIDGERVR